MNILQKIIWGITGIEKWVKLVEDLTNTLNESTEALHNVNNLNEKLFEENKKLKTRLDKLTILNDN